MDDWYFILRVGTVIAFVAGTSFCAGMLLGKFLWQGGKGGAVDSGSHSRNLEGERGQLRDPAEKLGLDT